MVGLAHSSPVPPNGECFSSISPNIGSSAMKDCSFAREGPWCYEVDMQVRRSEDASAKSLGRMSLVNETSGNADTSVE